MIDLAEMLTDIDPSGALPALATQLLWLAILALAVASVAWTVKLATWIWLASQ